MGGARCEPKEVRGKGRCPLRFALGAITPDRHSPSLTGLAVHFAFGPGGDVCYGVLLILWGGITYKAVRLPSFRRMFDVQEAMRLWTVQWLCRMGLLHPWEGHHQ